VLGCCAGRSRLMPGPGAIQPLPGLFIAPTWYGETSRRRHALAGTIDDRWAKAMGRCGVSGSTQNDQQAQSHNPTHRVASNRLDRAHVAFHPMLPCHPVCRSRNATPPGARLDAASSTRRAAARPSGRTASRPQRSPRW